MEEKFNKVIELFKEATKKDCYKIDLVDGEPSITDDKLGGKPYLPIGEEYPKDKDGNNLALLLQVNLKDIELDGYLNYCETFKLVFDDENKLIDIKNIKLD